jgi:hypothetical protein
MKHPDCAGLVKLRQANAPADDRILAAMTKSRKPNVAYCRKQAMHLKQDRSQASHPPRQVVAPRRIESRMYCSAVRKKPATPAIL